MINALIFAGLSEKKLNSKILPIINSEYTDKIYLVRRNKNYQFPNDKLIQINYKFKQSFSLLFELFKIIIGRNIIVNKNINLVIGIHSYHALFAYILAKKYKIKFIFMMVESYDRINGSFWKKFINQKADYIVLRGNKTFNELSRNLKTNNYKVIPNHFEFQDHYNKYEIKYDLIYIGVLSKIKRLDILINAVCNIKVQRNIELRVCIVGEGELGSEYKKLVRLKGVENNFIFVGNQANVNNFLMQSKAFIMTSEFEGLPQAMIEALACGLPVIMPNISNIPEYAIEGYNALLVEPLDIKGYSEAIYKLMSDEALYGKLKSGAEKFREEYKHEFSMENIVDSWNQIFYQLGLIKEDNAK